MPPNQTATGKRRLTYTTLSGIFMALFAGFNLLNRKNKEQRLTPLDYIQLGFASYRLGRMVSYDKVMEGYRAPFVETTPDPTGMGMTTEPRGSGVRHAIGDLICCPICVGTWIAAGLVYGLNLLPKPTRVFLNITSSIGLAELLDAATEALEWTGQNQREQAGTERASHAPRVPRNRFGDEPVSRYPSPGVARSYEDRVKERPAS